MTAHSAEGVRPEDLLDTSYVALNVEPFEGGCDVCQESDKRIVHVDDECRVCDECMRDERVAIAAAAMALAHAPEQGDWPDADHYLALAELALNAYVAAKFQQEHSDGPEDGS